MLTSPELLELEAMLTRLRQLRDKHTKKPWRFPLTRVSELRHHFNQVTDSLDLLLSRVEQGVKE